MSVRWKRRVASQEISLKSPLVGKAGNRANSPRHRMERVAFLTEFSPKVRHGILQDFPWLTGTAPGGGQGVEVFSLM